MTDHPKLNRVKIGIRTVVVVETAIVNRYQPPSTPSYVFVHELLKPYKLYAIRKQPVLAVTH